MANTDFKTGTFDKSTNTSTPVDQAITGLGFQPKGLIIFSVSDFGTAVDGYNVSIGFSDGTNTKCAWQGSEHNAATTDCYRYEASGKIIVIRGHNDGSLLAEADLKSFDSDGFTLTWTTNSASAYKIKYVAFGGSNITSVQVGHFDTTTTAGPTTQNVSALASGNLIAILTTATTTTGEDTLNSGCTTSLGFASGASNQGVCSSWSRDNQGTSGTQHSVWTDSIIAFRTDTPTTILDGQFGGFTGSGFDINWTTTDATSRRLYYMIVKGGTWQVGSGTTNTTTGTKSFTTSFKPAGLIVALSNTATADPSAVNGSFGMGAADGTNNASFALQDEDGQATSDTGRDSSATACLLMVDQANSRTEVAALSSFNSTNFTLNFTTSDATARTFIWAVVQEDLGGGGGPFPHYTKRQLTGGFVKC